VAVVERGAYKGNDNKGILTVSASAQKAFSTLLHKTVRPYIEYPFLGGYGFDRFNKLSAKQRATLKRELKIPQHQKAVARLIKNWKEFAFRHPKEHYLSSYAKLFACILQSIWSENTSLILKDFEALEKESASLLSVALIAGWYRCAFLWSLHAPESSLEFGKFAERYREHRWWVVRAATYMSKHTVDKPVVAEWKPLRTNPYIIVETIYLNRQLFK
jgi:hypothetical protein